MANINSYPNNQDVYIGAEEVMRWHHGRTSGVYGAGNNAAVAAVQGTMAVTVSDGNGWLSNSLGFGIAWWINNEAVNGSKLKLTIDPADSTLNRIDRVIVEWKTTNYVDYPEVKILKGTPNSTASAPALTNNTTLRQISLARISIAAGTTAITSAMITDERLNSSVCGIVTETVQADTSVVNSQFQALLDHYQDVIDQAVAEQVPDNSVTTEKLVNGAVTNTKVANKAITRSKLADDAAYSPVVNVTASRNLQASDGGKTLMLNTSGANITFTITKSFSDSMPIGTEIAILWWTGTGITIAATENVYMNMLGFSGYKQNTTAKLTERFGMAALKKITNTGWYLSGNVEEV